MDFKNNSAQDNSDGGELIIGRNPVTEALKSDILIDRIFISDTFRDAGFIVKAAREKNITIKKTAQEKLNAMSGGKSHQGVIASAACAEYVTVEEILSISKKKGSNAFIIICDGIQDPHNLGAIIRAAEAAGADGIIIPKNRSASLNATVYRTSAGAASHLPAARAVNITAAIEELKRGGVWIYGTDASGDKYSDSDLTGDLAFVIGSEGSGLSRLVKENCDFLLSLPMAGRMSSLNASVAAGIFMYEAVRQRGAKT